MGSPQFGCFRYTLVLICLLTVIRLNFCKHSDDLHQMREIKNSYVIEDGVNNGANYNLPDQNDIYKTFDIDTLQKRKNEFIRFGKRKNEFIRLGKRNNINYDNEMNDQMSRIYPLYEFFDGSDIHKTNKRKNEFIRFG